MKNILLLFTILVGYKDGWHKEKSPMEVIDIKEENHLKERRYYNAEKQIVQLVFFHGQRVANG